MDVKMLSMFGLSFIQHQPPKEGCLQPEASKLLSNELKASSVNPVARYGVSKNMSEQSKPLFVNFLQAQGSESPEVFSKKTDAKEDPLSKPTPLKPAHQSAPVTQAFPSDEDIEKDQPFYHEPASRGGWVRHLVEPNSDSKTPFDGHAPSEDSPIITMAFPSDEDLS